MTRTFVDKALTTRALPIVLSVAALLRLAMYPFIGVMNPRTWEYEWIATNMTKGLGYAYPWGVHGGVERIWPSAFMPPGQVMLDYIAFVFFGTGHVGHIALFVEEAILSVLFVYVAYKLLRTCFADERIAMLGAWALALYPSFIVTAGSFGVTAAVLVLDAALLLAVARYFHAVENRTRTGRSVIAIGLTAGLLTFFRSEAYPVLALTALVLVWQFRAALRGRALDLVKIAAIALITISPWIIRNYITLDKVIVGSTSGKFNFWRGHNPDATGSSWMDNGDAVWTSEAMYNEIDSLYGRSPNIEEQSGNYHLAKALEYMQTHPAREAELALKKPVLLWTIDWYSKKARTAPYVLLYAITVALTVLGIAEWRSSRTRTLAARSVVTLIATWLVLYTLIVMAFFALPRFQVILVGIYFPFVVLGLKRVLKRLGLWQPASIGARREYVAEPAMLSSL